MPSQRASGQFPSSAGTRNLAVDALFQKLEASRGFRDQHSSLLTRKLNRKTTTFFQSPISQRVRHMSKHLPGVRRPRPHAEKLVFAPASLDAARHAHYRAPWRLNRRSPTTSAATTSPPCASSTCQDRRSRVTQIGPWLPAAQASQQSRSPIFSWPCLHHAATWPRWRVPVLSGKALAEAADVAAGPCGDPCGLSCCSPKQPPPKNSS